MHVLLELIKRGVIVFDDEKGHIILRGEAGIILPVRTLNLLFKNLLETNQEEGKKLITMIAEKQITNAVRRYKEVFRIEKISLNDIMFNFLQFLEVLGIGKPQFTVVDEKTIIISLESILAKEYVLEYGKREQSWDLYIEKLLEFGFEKMLNRNVECKEVKCIAKGDEICEFILKIQE